MSRSQSRELSIKIDNSNNLEEKQEEKPTLAQKNNFMESYEMFSKKLEANGFDVYMLLELLVFVLSFFFWVGESDDKDVRKFDSLYLYDFNALLMIDFLFRMLSLKIESVKRENWNHVLHCVFPLVMWLLASFYKFDNVFGGDTIQVLNTILFTFLNVIVLLILLFKFVTLDQLKELCKKKEENNEEQVNDVELGN